MFFNPEGCRNETEVESKLIVQYLLPVLGYNPKTWYQEVTLGSIRLDFLVFAAQMLPIAVTENSPLSLVVEVKSPKHNLNPHISKLKRYLTYVSAPYGLLTNGKELKIFERQGQEIELVFQCKGTEIEETLAEIKSIIGREEIKQRRLGLQLFPQPSQEEQNKVQEQIISDENETRLSTHESANNIIENTKEIQSTSETQNIQQQREDNKMKTIAVYHNKGGVGKTTTVVNLAAALSKQGQKVLVIDLDSQANTTFAVGLIKFDDEANDTLKDRNILHLLSSEELYPIQDIARPTSFCSTVIDVVPSHIDLMKAESDLIGDDNSRFILMQKLDEVEGQYDIAIIDTPPSLNIFAKYALMAADYLIIPSDLKPFSNQGLVNVKALIQEVNAFRKRISRKPLEILGVLATKVSTNNRFKQSTLPKRMQAVMERYEIEVMESIIFERDDLAKCSEITEIVNSAVVPNPRSVLDFKPESKAAQEFNCLALEVLKKIR